MLSNDRYMAYSPSPSTGPQSPHLSLPEHEQYLTELLDERNKFGPFMPLLPFTSRLLNQEIFHVSALLGIHVLDQPGFQHCSPLINGGAFPNGRTSDMNGLVLAFSSEMEGMFHSPPLSKNWLNARGNSSGFIVKKTMRMDIPVDNYPHFNIVGQLLDPRGSYLKRVEAEFMRWKPGYEHLDEPLHLLIEAELPVEIIDIRLMQAREILDNMLKPVNESRDFFKREQLRKLAMINGTLGDDASQNS